MSIGCPPSHGFTSSEESSNSLYNSVRISSSSSEDEETTCCSISLSISTCAIFRKRIVFSTEKMSSSSCFRFSAFLSFLIEGSPGAFSTRLYSVMYSLRWFLNSM